MYHSIPPHCIDLVQHNNLLFNLMIGKPGNIFQRFEDTCGVGHRKVPVIGKVFYTLFWHNVHDSPKIDIIILMKHL